jgi:hypothetical protein
MCHSTRLRADSKNHRHRSASGIISDRLKLSNRSKGVPPCGPNCSSIFPSSPLASAATISRPRPARMFAAAEPLSVMRHSTNDCDDLSSTRITPPLSRNAWPAAFVIKYARPPAAIGIHPEGGSTSTNSMLLTSSLERLIARHSWRR